MKIAAETIHTAGGCVETARHWMDAKKQRMPKRIVVPAISPSDTALRICAKDAASACVRSWILASRCWRISGGMDMLVRMLWTRLRDPLVVKNTIISEICCAEAYSTESSCFSTISMWRWRVVEENKARNAVVASRVRQQIPRCWSLP